MKVLTYHKQNLYAKYRGNKPFNYIRHDVNQGKDAANHTGIAQATGDYLLERDAYQEYDVVYGSTIYGRLLAPHPTPLALIQSSHIAFLTHYDH